VAKKMRDKEFIFFVTEGSRKWLPLRLKFMSKGLNLFNAGLFF